ncbi:membrane-bound lytic murein transglycosylase MltF [Shewanella kaireitica]|uniref:membrane-bound lytic murein transglycosylase MltF n=1 Tax=Shewanella kaireitica TaxID=212021 RepID=UPI0020103446|nr:membrane-bound lytic murein transglycosylase MltF [Shewanella kaireitica]MCL1093704.1 membrane-bound lytic murein transglycosylase MltF [Shewanella kaireitica]
MRKLCLIFCCITLLAACQKVVVEQKQVAVIEPKTELVVGTLFGPQIYFSSGQGESGYDYEMAARFAKYLNLELKMMPFANISELYGALKAGKIDIIAAGLADTPSRREKFRVGPPLYRVNQVLVYRQGTRPPKDINDLEGDITVITDSSFVDTLSELQKSNPNLMWKQEKDKDSEELLAMIASGDLQYTIADSTSLDINRRFMPELREGAVLKEKQPVVWLLPPNNSDRLMSQLLAFWHIEKRSGTLAHLNEKYFAHVRRFDYVDTRAFIRAIDNKLPKYQETFEKYAGDIDWRKLAATAYQESHWNPNARSPTGVRGLMMLTLPTAKQVGIKNRLDPYQSIQGGAKYLNSMLERLPASIPESQRMWFALASYNIGFGHVEDARKLAQSMGLNPSAWRDIKEVLPLLQKRKHYKKTRYGYARGNEAVHYVDSIRRYYDTLVWIDNQNILLDLKSDVTQTADNSGQTMEGAQPQ